MYKEKLSFVHEWIFIVVDLNIFFTKKITEKIKLKNIAS